MPERKTRAHLHFEQRKEKIKALIPTHNYAEIAAQCGVSERTIKRDVRAMKRSGEWFDWIEAELFRLHREGDISDTVRYKAMADLYKKTLRERIEAEVKQQTKEKVIIRAWDPDREEELDELLRRFPFLFPEVAGDAEKQHDDE